MTLGPVVPLPAVLVRIMYAGTGHQYGAGEEDASMRISGDWSRKQELALTVAEYRCALLDGWRSRRTGARPVCGKSLQPPNAGLYSTYSIGNSARQERVGDPEAPRTM